MPLAKTEAQVQIIQGSWILRPIPVKEVGKTSLPTVLWGRPEAPSQSLKADHCTAFFLNLFSSCGPLPTLGDPVLQASP